MLAFLVPRSTENADQPNGISERQKCSIVHDGTLGPARVRAEKRNGHSGNFPPGKKEPDKEENGRLFIFLNLRMEKFYNEKLNCVGGARKTASFFGKRKGTRQRCGQDEEGREGAKSLQRASTRS